jgi:hypothetical protein
LAEDVFVVGQGRSGVDDDDGLYMDGKKTSRTVDPVEELMSNENVLAKSRGPLVIRSDYENVFR